MKYSQRKIDRRRGFTTIGLLLALTFCLLTFVLFVGIVRKDALVKVVALVGLCVWALARRQQHEKTKATACSICGEQPSNGRAPMHVCASCHQRRQAVADIRRRVRRMAWTYAAAWGAIEAYLFLAGLRDGFFMLWSFLPLIAVVVYLLAYARAMARVRRIGRRSERGAPLPGLNQWDIDATGRVTPVSGEHGPLDAVIREAVRRVQANYRRLAGSVVEFPLALRVVQFGTIAEVKKTLQIFSLDARQLAVAYIGRPSRRIIYCQESVRRQLCDPTDALGAALAYAPLDHRNVMRLPAWLNVGVAPNIARGWEPATSDRLQRAAHCMVACGQTLGPDIFRLSQSRFVAHYRQTFNHGDFVYAQRFSTQATSLVEYLVTAAPSMQRRGFEALVTELLRAGRGRHLSEAHLHIPPEELLAAWRAWVAGRGIGAFHAPGDTQRTAIVEELIPLVRDKDARFIERLFAIRTLGARGFVLGADALIERLADDREAPGLREASHWALQMISGQPLGERAEDWMSWWDELPEDLKADDAVSVRHG